MAEEKKQPIVCDIEGLYEMRMLAFIEMAPQSNHYHRILFTAEEYKKLTVFIVGLFPCKENCGKKDCCGPIISDDGVDMPDVQAVHLCAPDVECEC